MMPATTNNLKEAAEFYRWALLFELVEQQEVREWCVQVASKHPNPPQVLVDAALAKESAKETLRAALEQVPGRYDPAAAERRLFALQWEYLRGSPDRLENVLMQLSYEPFNRTDEPPEEEYYFQVQWFNILTDVYMAGAKQAATKELHDNVLSFLEHARHGDLTGYERKETDWPLNKYKYRGFYRNGMLTCIVSLFLVPLKPELARWEVLGTFVVLGLVLGALHWQASRANKALERSYKITS